MEHIGYKIDDNTTDKALVLEPILRASIGQELTDQEWYALAYKLECAVEVAVEDAVSSALDNMRETLADYEMALDDEAAEEDGLLF